MNAVYSGTRRLLTLAAFWLFLSVGGAAVVSAGNWAQFHYYFTTAAPVVGVVCLMYLAVAVVSFLKGGRGAPSFDDGEDVHKIDNTAMSHHPVSGLPMSDDHFGVDIGGNPVGTRRDDEL